METHVTLEGILALPELQECRLLCPDVRCDRVVKSVTIMDNPHILDWLSDYELLFSNGSAMVDFTAEQWIRFLNGLVERRVPALFIKLSYFVARMPDDVVAYTRRIGFPVVVVPNSYSWMRISDPIQRYMINRQFYGMRESLHLRDALNAQLSKGAGIDDLCGTASRALHQQVAVFTSDWILVGGSSYGRWGEVACGLLRDRPHMRPRVASEGSQAPFHRLFLPEGDEVTFFPLPDRQGTHLVAFAWTGDGPSELDSFKMDQVCIALMLCIHKAIELRRIERRFYQNFLSDLIEGALDDKQKIDEQASRLGRRVHDAYQLAVFSPTQGEANEELEGLLAARKRRGAVLDDVLVCLSNKQAVLFIPFLCHEDRETIDAVCALARESLGFEGEARCGISGPQPVQKACVAFDEAQFALSVGRLAGRANVYYDDLGLLRLMERNSRSADVSFIAELYERTMGDLVAADRENGSSLVKTLEAYLCNNRSMPDTARELYVHENTLRARIKRVEAITGRSLKATMDVVELALGVQIHHFIECEATARAHRARSCEWPPSSP